ncbi:SidA/IucD/PvdA family monooxygenase [Rhizobium leguminosarum]|uniref:SidA/IucD/PvdA family monooxygenase n=1 Tax=Rhizobium leguminosarum TaxID=384 RepID=UPI003ECE6FCB
MELKSSYDVLGIGFGPSNLALAIAAEEANVEFDLGFLEGAVEPSWQAGMLLPGSDIQNNPLRDLVTPRNPRSRYTFTNYLKEAGRLLEYLNLGLVFPLRSEYADYIRWAAEHFNSEVSYGTVVHSITWDSKNSNWLVYTNRGMSCAKVIVLGTGRSRNIPDIFKNALGKRVFHLSDYIPMITALQASVPLRSIAVVGASQSAVEVHLDLLSRIPEVEIHAIYRSFSIRQKDVSPFSERAYLPEFVDYFYGLSDEDRSDLRRQLRPTNYGAADADVIHELYVRIYEERLRGRDRFFHHNNSTVRIAEAGDLQVRLQLSDRYSRDLRELSVDAVVLATGFLDLGLGEGKEPYPPVLTDAAEALGVGGGVALRVGRDYRVVAEGGGPMFLNGLCESSHGLGDAGSFSLISLRASDILSSLERWFDSSILGIGCSRD